MKIRFQTLSALVCAALLAASATGMAAAAEKDPPITVEANHMTSVEKESSVIFTGDVDARQGGIRIRANKMIVYYADKSKTDADVKQKVEKLVCNGDVEVSRDDWLGTSKDMVYLSRTRQFILMGDARAWRGKNMVSGDKIIYYIDEGRSEVVGDRVSGTTGSGTAQDSDKGRVKMTIIQE